MTIVIFVVIVVMLVFFVFVVVVAVITVVGGVARRPLGTRLRLVLRHRFTNNGAASTTNPGTQDGAISTACGLAHSRTSCAAHRTTDHSAGLA